MASSSRAAYSIQAKRTNKELKKAIADSRRLAIAAPTSAEVRAAPLAITMGGFESVTAVVSPQESCVLSVASNQPAELPLTLNGLMPVHAPLITPDTEELALIAQLANVSQARKQPLHLSRFADYCERNVVADVVDGMGPIKMIS